MTIQKKLEIQLKEIVLIEKNKHGLLLNFDDVKVIFSILKQNDKEMKPMLEVLESSLLLLDLKNEYVFIEDAVKNILIYYNIIGDKNLINCRHKFFFTQEQNKLTKKPFFSPKTIENIKTELTINNILEKIK